MTGETSRQGCAGQQVSTRHGRALTSYYARWIEADLSRWKKTLISRVRVIPVEGLTDAPHPSWVGVHAVSSRVESPETLLHVEILRDGKCWNLHARTSACSTLSSIEKPT